MSYIGYCRKSTDEKTKQVLSIESQIEELKKLGIAKKKEYEGPSPYVEILKHAIQESEEKSLEAIAKRQKLVEVEKELPYYEFWVKAFGDSGIRKFVIDGIVPALNSRIAYWMQFLCNSKYKLLFDNEFHEKIERNPADGNPFIYFLMSAGERRRLNLSVAQGFGYVARLNSGATSSVIFLDEVTTNIDQLGVEGIYNMIMELSREKQVFVTTHDRDLLAMLSGCHTINLVKKDGFTSLKKS